MCPLPRYHVLGIDAERLRDRAIGVHSGTKVAVAGRVAAEHGQRKMGKVTRESIIEEAKRAAEAVDGPLEVIELRKVIAELDG